MRCSHLQETMNYRIFLLFFILFLLSLACGISNNEEEYIPQYNDKVNRDDTSGEDNTSGATRQSYYQTPTQSSVKLTRDSDIGGFVGGFNGLQSKGGGFRGGVGNFGGGGIGTLDHGGGGFLYSGGGSTSSNFGSSGGSNFGHGSNFGGNSGFSHGFGGGSSSFGQGGGSGSSGFGSTNFGHGGGSGSGSFGSGLSFGHGGGSGGGGGGGYSYAGDTSGGGGGYQQAPIIHKSVYVHVAPPEDDVPRQKVVIPNIPPKKNYQIVFIKAPTIPPPSVPVIPAFPAQSDKTLIYVLHPKPEEAPPIHIPAPPQPVPVKPEVYFIRYKTRTVQDGGDGGGSSYGGGGGSSYGGGGSGGGGGGGYHRRYGRDGSELDDETLDASDTASRSVPPENEVPTLEYEDRTEQLLNDSSGESSNIRDYTTERGKNAH